MADEDIGNEVDLDSIEDEPTLVQLLEETEDFDERKMIRARLREVQAVNRAKRDEMFKKREQEREDAVKRKATDAADQKRRTLQMYDQMAKSAPAGGHKTMDINIYKNSEGSPSSSGRTTPTVTGAAPRDLVEESIRARAKDSEDRKKRILAAYDSAAKSGPAGSFRVIDFDGHDKADVSEYAPPTPTKGCCFGSSGGIPLKRGPSLPGTPTTPMLPGGPLFPVPADLEAHLDPMERAIRARVKASDEKKRRTLAAYDIIAKTGDAGPKMVILEEFANLQVDDDHQLGTTHRPTSSFRGGVLTPNKTITAPKQSCCSRGGPK